MRSLVSAFFPVTRMSRRSAFLVATTALTLLSAEAFAKGPVPEGMYEFGQVLVAYPKKYDDANRCTGSEAGHGPVSSTASKLESEGKGDLTIYLGSLQQFSDVSPGNAYVATIYGTAKMKFDGLAAGSVSFLSDAYANHIYSGSDHGEQLPVSGKFEKFVFSKTKSGIKISFDLETTIKGVVPCQFKVEALYYK